MINLDLVLKVVAALLWLSVPATAISFFGKDNFSSWSSLAIGILGLAISTFWSSKIDRRQAAELKAALPITVTPEDVISVTNEGRTPITIARTSTVTRSYERRNARQEFLLNEFQLLKTALVENVASSGSVLSTKESIAILTQSGSLRDIEEEELVIQLVAVSFLTGNDHKTHTKYVGIYRLTSPEQWFLHEVSQNNDVNLAAAENKLIQTGPFYWHGKLVRFILMKAKEHPYDPDIFPTSQSIDAVISCEKKYHELSQTSIDPRPQDKWYINRIEEF